MYRARPRVATDHAWLVYQYRSSKSMLNIKSDLFTLLVVTFTE
jgi:hypothetical protein